MGMIGIRYDEMVAKYPRIYDVETGREIVGVVSITIHMDATSEFRGRPVMEMVVDVGVLNMKIPDNMVSYTEVKDRE